ncbi:hypothetical protein LLG96_09645 [bacterium]|nr:hypothetical protein [bacterium]
MKRLLGIVLLTFLCASVLYAQADKGKPGSANPYVQWKNGLPKDPGFFPLTVWLQDPEDAQAYKKAGINVFVGLWQGPTEEQLAQLRAAGMPAICSQNDVGLKYKDDPIIVGWMHGDEPDNAQQPIIDGKWSPPILPEKIIADYKKIIAADPSRPVFLNIGQGVAWNNYIGRGVRRNHPEDYAEYVKGGDIVSFDIYPVVHRNPEIQGNLWYVARGVDRLRTWTNNQKIVWNCIETTQISSDTRPTPRQVKAEVWMSIIHGSMGIVYFVHAWKPKEDTRRLLNDPEMLAAVTALNGEIRNLAPVINSPTFHFGAEVTSSQPGVPVDVLVKRYEDALYVFAVCMRDSGTKASFFVSLPNGDGTAEVIGEGRTIPVTSGGFEDDFKPYDVHLYRIK